MRKRIKLTKLFVLAALSFAAYACSEEAKSPLEMYKIEVSKDTFSFDEKGGTASFVLTTNEAWEINTASDWFTYDPVRDQSGANSVTVNIVVPAWDVEDSERSATISIKCGDLSKDAVVRTFLTLSQTGPKSADRAPGIWNLSDLVEFGAVVSAVTADTEGDYSKWQDENGVINLWKDINAGSEALPLMGSQETANTTAGAFAAEFNGNGHTITGKLESKGNPIVALFTRLAPTGIIKNLNLDVTVTNDYSGSVQKHAAGLVGFSVTATTGYIENCTVKGSITMTGTTTNPRVGGIIAYGRCNITDCKNYATITANCNRVGGICGAGGNAYTFTRCENHGDINVECSAAQVGGIIGQLNKQILLGCKNTGNITAKGGGALVVGGLAGDAKGSGGAIGSEELPCSNTGKITVNACETAYTAAAAAGGISGDVTEAITVSYCTNEGEVTSNSDDALVSASGIIGYTTKTCTALNCINKAKVVSAANAGGIIGKATAAAMVTKCENAGEISALAGATTAPAFFGCIVGNGAKTVLSECVYGGTVLGNPGTESNAKGQ